MEERVMELPDLDKELSNRACAEDNTILQRKIIS